MKQLLEGNGRLGPVLLVEDEDNDALLLRRAFQLAKVENPVLRACDGQQAIDFLLTHPGGPAGEQLRLIITDVKMPKLDGFELLTWLQTQPRFHQVPKIAFSSSVLQRDLERCVGLGATTYFAKPNSHAELVELVREWKRAFLQGEPPC